MVVLDTPMLILKYICINLRYGVMKERPAYLVVNDNGKRGLYKTNL